jgi:hypothetical protein
MPNIAVKCPVCGQIRVIRRRSEQKTFYHCGLTHIVSENIVAEGVNLRKALKNQTQNREKIITINDILALAKENGTENANKTEDGQK